MVEAAVESGQGPLLENWPVLDFTVTSAPTVAATAAEIEAANDAPNGGEPAKPTAVEGKVIVVRHEKESRLSEPEKEVQEMIEMSRTVTLTFVPMGINDLGAWADSAAPKVAAAVAEHCGCDVRVDSVASREESLITKDADSADAVFRLVFTMAQSEEDRVDRLIELLTKKAWVNELLAPLLTEDNLKAPAVQLVTLNAHTDPRTASDGADGAEAQKLTVPAGSSGIMFAALGGLLGLAILIGCILFGLKRRRGRYSEFDTASKGSTTVQAN